MSGTPGDPSARLDARVTELEILLTHMQQTVQDLDEVIRQQGARLDAFERLVARQQDELRELAQPPSEPRRLEDDKPPHY